MRRRGLHGAKRAYERQQAEATERARHRELIAADLDLNAVEELLEDMWSDRSQQLSDRIVDGIGVECRCLRKELDVLLAGSRHG